MTAVPWILGDRDWFITVYCELPIGCVSLKPPLRFPANNLQPWDLKKKNKTKPTCLFHPTPPIPETQVRRSNGAMLGVKMEKTSLKAPLRMFVTSNHPKLPQIKSSRDHPQHKTKKAKQKKTSHVTNAFFFKLNATKSTW